MRIRIVFTKEPVAVPDTGEDDGCGAVLTFAGKVRGSENGARIGGLRYEIYHAMAERVARAIIAEIAATHPVSGVTFIHREGDVATGETAVLIVVESRHRGEGLRFMETFLNRMKADVPIWKTGVLP